MCLPQDQPDLLAVVRHGGTKPLTPELDRLLRAVPLRRTNRHPFSDVPVAPHEQNALRRAAQQEGGWLHIVQAREQRTGTGVIAVPTVGSGRSSTLQPSGRIRPRTRSASVAIPRTP